MQDFNTLTDTGKHRAIQIEQKKTETLKRLLLGIVRIVFESNYDDVTEAIMRWEERDAKDSKT